MPDSISPVDPRQGTTRTDRYLFAALFLITGTMLAQALISQGLPVLYPFIQNEFALSRAQVGLITSSYSMGIGATILLAGWLTDSLGVKRMTIISLLSMTVLTLAFPLAHAFPVVLALAALLGIAVSPLHPASTVAIIDWFPGRVRALAMSLKKTGIPIGGALTAALLPLLSLTIGWRMAAAVTGLLALAIVAAFASFYRDAPRSTQTVHKFNLITLKTMLRNRGLVISIIWLSTFVGFQSVVMTYFMLFLIEEAKLTPIMAGHMLAIAQFSSIIARVAWGAASDFIFHGRRIAVLAITGFLTVFWTLAASFMGGESQSTAVYFIAILIGVSTISFHGVSNTLIGEQAEAGQVGLTVGVASTANNINQVIMPPIFGLLVDITSSYSLAWRAVAAIALVCTLALMVFGREPQRR